MLNLLQFGQCGKFSGLHLRRGYTSCGGQSTTSVGGLFAILAPLCGDSAQPARCPSLPLSHWAPGSKEHKDPGSLPAHRTDFQPPALANVKGKACNVLVPPVTCPRARTAGCSGALRSRVPRLRLASTEFLKSSEGGPCAVNLSELYTVPDVSRRASPCPRTSASNGCLLCWELGCDTLRALLNFCWSSWIPLRSFPCGTSRNRGLFDNYDGHACPLCTQHAGAKAPEGE
jgi:hypothetical protein